MTRAVESAGVLFGSREPSRAVVIACLFGFILVWAVTLSIGNAPFPILHDMTEAYAWGREFQLGYNQHPPFWAWVCGAWFLIFPRTGWAFAALDALNAGVGLAGAWALIGDFARGPKRVASLALLLLTPFYTLGCYKYDANTIFLSLWPWTTHVFVVSLRSRRPGAAIGLGVLLALSLMSKYYALVLVAVCGLGAVQTPWVSAWLRSASPWICAIVAALLVSPHVYWLLTHAAPPLRYLHEITGRRLVDIIGDAGATAASSVVGWLPFLAVIGFFARGGIGDRARQFPGRWRVEPELRLMATLAAAPLLLTLIAGVAARTKLTPEMPVGTYALVPLLAIETLGPRDPAKLALCSVRLAFAWLAVMLIASPVVALGRLWLSGAGAKIPPQEEIAAAATRIWREQVGRPLSFVAGRGYENAVVFYSPDPARSFYDFDYSKNLWVTAEELAKFGLTSICLATDDQCLSTTKLFLTPTSKQTKVTVAHRYWGHVSRPYEFVVTTVPPRS